MSSLNGHISNRASAKQQAFIVGWLARHGKEAYRNVKSICDIERDKPITRLTRQWNIYTEKNKKEC